MAQPWLDAKNVPLPQNFVDKIGGHPIVAQTLANRGITNADEALAFLNPNYYISTPPIELPGLSQAADRLERGINAHEIILVWGDFDVDGQTATTLLVEALRDLGATVQYHIPVRATEGHGIHPRILKQYLRTNQESVTTPANEYPTILLTCDTGIAAHPAINFANSVGVDVIITDHHEPVETIPNAFAVINPHLLPSSEHPLASLPGVGVAFLLMKELYRRRGNPENADRYLDLVALGIVVDVARLTADTRYLLQNGLKALRTTPRLGLQALYKMIELNPDNLDESHIGFSIGPRLNALGRLSDANRIVEFFTTEDATRADILAIEIDGLNHQRRSLTEQVYRAAISQIEQEPDHLTYAALVLAHPGWPGGILGLVASRLVEQYHKPTILLNIQENGKASGSARSVEALDITHALRQQADLLDRFGGHAGAAGLSLPAENIHEFTIRLSRTIKQMASTLDWKPGLKIDAYIPFTDLNLELVDEIHRLAPFGSGNPPIILASRHIQWISTTGIGRNQEHLRLIVEDRDGCTQEVLWWRGDLEQLPPQDTLFDLAFQAKSNTFQGERRLQLEWVDYHLDENAPKQAETEPQDTIKIIDNRSEARPIGVLTEIAAREPVQVWAEGEVNLPVKCVTRKDLSPSSSLAIWTVPPNRSVLQSAIRRVKPEQIYWFANDPGLDSFQPFITRLAGLIKKILKDKGNPITIFELASAMAQTATVTKMGLLCLQAYGLILIEILNEESLFISPGNEKRTPDLVRIKAELQGMLKETAAFRQYLSSASTDSLQILISKLE